MNALADKYSGKKIGSIFVYTHEAHPGEIYPHLTSMDQKFKNALDLRDLLEVSRPILVDSLDGACHHAYRSIPNISWIISRSDIPVYKADWTDVVSVEAVLVYFLSIGDRRRNGERLASFPTQRLDYRIQGQEAF